MVPRSAAAAVLGLTLLATAAMPAKAQENDLREFRVGVPVADLPQAGYQNFTCASAPDR